MTIELLVDAPEFLGRAREDLRAAREYAYVQCNTFEGDAGGRAVADALLASPAPDRRVIVDTFTRYVISDRFRWHPRSLVDTAFKAEVRATFEMFDLLRTAGVGVRFTNPVGPLLWRFPGRNHKKLVDVDGRIAYVGGLCFADHNFAWHDAMLRIEDERAACFLASDFLATWQGRHHGASAGLPGLTLHALDGCSNESFFAEVLALFDTARESVFVEVPYLTQPFLARLRAASERGVAVVVVTPRANNWKLAAALVRREAARGAFELRLFDRGMLHMKAALVDDRVLVIGSANFDSFSYRTQQEYVCIATDADLVGQFRARVVEPDLRDSTPCTAAVGRFAAGAADLGGHGLDHLARLWKRAAVTPALPSAL
jgi:cardiolipin synthase